MKMASLIELANPASVKIETINILSKEWPLNVRKLHSMIRVKNDVSYHAVHKAVQQLVAEGVLRREKVGYMINLGWVDDAVAILERMRHEDTCKTPVYFPGLKEFYREGASQTFVFENLAAADEYRKRLQFEYGTVAEGVPYCGTAQHLRTPIVYSEKSMRIMNLVKQRGVPCFIAVSSDTPLDKWCANYYMNDGVNVTTGVSALAQNCETMVLGDVITQIYISQAVRNSIDQIYTSVRNVRDLNIPDFFKRVYLLKAETKFVVMYNPEIAAQLRAQILGHFKKR